MFVEREASEVFIGWAVDVQVPGGFGVLPAGPAYIITCPFCVESVVFQKVVTSDELNLLTEVLPVKFKEIFGHMGTGCGKDKPGLPAHGLGLPSVLPLLP